MNGMKSMVERRKHARIAICIDYKFKFDKQIYCGETGNISLGGVYLERVEPTLPQEYLSQQGELTLKLGHEELTVISQIVFIGGGVIQYPAGVGLAFQDLSDEQSELLKGFIMRNL